MSGNAVSTSVPSLEEQDRGDELTEYHDIWLSEEGILQAPWWSLIGSWLDDKAILQPRRTSRSGDWIVLVHVC